MGWLALALAFEMMACRLGTGPRRKMLPSGVLLISYGCSTVVPVCFTCPAITVVTVILRALEGSVRGHFAGWPVL